MTDEQVEVRRSARRRRTISAYRDGSRIIVMIPARLTRAQEAEAVSSMVKRIRSGEQRGRRHPRSDATLTERAELLSRTYLGGHAKPASVRWVATMRTRWASCTPVDHTIRMSDRLKQLPVWVQDYVLVHELAHLLVPGHGPDFWALVAHYPKTERARGYLDGVSAAAGLDFAADLAEDVADET
ncbi:MAG: M48 family metallopeptidase [Jatrophihabitantaceae bacterium]